MNTIQKNTEKDLDYVKKIHTMMGKNKFLLSYRGATTQAITKSLLFLTEKKMELEQEENTVKKKVFGVMVECMQNICKSKTTSTANNGIVMISKSEKAYTVYVGNVIDKEKKEILSSKIEEINKLKKEELKEHHNFFMSKDINESSNLAILGLIDIAKKTENNIECYFEEINATETFFSLKTAIERF